LHLSGYDLPLEELKNFRQLHSKTPGHPEFGATPGVECTTGPLGQGIGNAVGMAMAGQMAAARFNTPNTRFSTTMSSASPATGVCRKAWGWKPSSSPATRDSTISF